MAGARAEAVIGNIEEHWRPIQAEIARLGESGIEQQTAACWSAKEMLAHIAFWDEAVEGAVISLFRQTSLPEGFAFGSGYVPAPDVWPQDFVHNAREAEWARGQSAAAVLARVESAHGRLLAFMQTVTNAEAEQNADYFAALGGHYAEHLPHLAALK